MRARTSGAMRSLLNLTPSTARRLRDDGEEVPQTRVGVGNRLRVRPGDKVSTHGKIVEGCPTLDESVIAGESAPVQKVQ